MKREKGSESPLFLTIPALLFSPCLCHSFSTFWRKQLNFLLRGFRVFSLCLAPSFDVFLPHLIHFLGSIHNREASFTSRWLPNRFLWRKRSLKPSFSMKVVLVSKPEGGCTISKFSSAQLIHSFQHVLHPMCSGDIQPRGPNST